jgi:hypothetical protein
MVRTPSNPIGSGGNVTVNSLANDQAQLDIAEQTMPFQFHLIKAFRRFANAKVMPVVLILIHTLLSDRYHAFNLNTMLPAMPDRTNDTSPAQHYLSPKHHVQIPGLPETTPSNIMLTQVLQVRRFRNQPRDLVNHILLFTRSSVSARQLLLDAGQDLERTRILHFLSFDVVGRWRNTTAMTTRLHGANRIDRRSVCVAHDRLSALRGE